MQEKDWIECPAQESPEEEVPRQMEAQEQAPEMTQGQEPEMKVPEESESVRRFLAQRLGLEDPDWKTLQETMTRQEEDERQSKEKRDELRQLHLRHRVISLREEWGKQGEALQSLYPEFSLNREGKDPRFRAMLAGGCSVREAYEALHPDMLSARIQRELAAKAPRVREGAATGTPCPLQESGLADLSRAEREALSRRVLRGERIEAKHPR